MKNALLLFDEFNHSPSMTDNSLLSSNIEQSKQIVHQDSLNSVPYLKFEYENIRLYSIRDRRLLTSRPKFQLIVLGFFNQYTPIAISKNG